MRTPVICHENCSRRQAATRGYTLVELLATVAVVAILAAVAAPSLQGFLARSGMQAVGNDFTIALQRARLDAIQRNTCVSLCQLAEGSTNSCDANARFWHRGWIVYTNPTCGTAPPAAAFTGTTAADVMVVRQPGNRRYQLLDLAAAPDDAITFDPRGSLIGGGTTFRTVDERDKDANPHGKDLVVSFQGRVNVTKVDVKRTTPTLDGAVAASSTRQDPGATPPAPTGGTGNTGAGG